ncbi:RNA polymerase sigma factor [Nonomuraea jabiensis]|uniref:RNA polymerase sigma factor n=1 Tax=Nonomuraea jabiensis TaxID=882448 RepID=UPI003D763AA6
MTYSSPRSPTPTPTTVALRRIGDVRDPRAVGPWLRMIVRNACRGLLRASRQVELVAEPPLRDADAGLGELLEQHALRDWVWEAVERLSPRFAVCRWGPYAAG